MCEASLADELPAPVGSEFRRLYDEVEDWLKKTCRRSAPKGFLVGPEAARLHKETGLVLRESGHRGTTVVPYR